MADVCSVKIFKLSVSKWVRKILNNGRRIDTFMTVDVLWMKPGSLSNYKGVICYWPSRRRIDPKDLEKKVSKTSSKFISQCWGRLYNQFSFLFLSLKDSALQGSKLFTVFLILKCIIIFKINIATNNDSSLFLYYFEEIPCETQLISQIAERWVLMFFEVLENHNNPENTNVKTILNKQRMFFLLFTSTFSNGVLMNTLYI